MVVARSDQVGRFLTYGSAHLAAVLAGVRVGGRPGWLLALGLMGIVSFGVWLLTLRKPRAVADTPTARIASAAQGYVEFEGRAQQHQGMPLRAALTQRECCWFRYQVQEKGQDGKWVTVDEGESAATFVVRDPSGSCSVDPEGAEVTCLHHQRWSEGATRCREWRIQHGDPLYVLGEFHSRSFAPGVATVREDVGELLAERKRDRRSLLQRFDRDRNGELDATEWELARATAQREVEQAHRQLHATSVLDTVRAPSDGRPFLLSCHSAAAQQRRLVWMARAHVAVVVAAAVGLAL